MQSNSNLLLVTNNLKFSLSGSVVQFFLNPFDKLVGYSTEVRTFWDVLPNESIRILIGLTFSRMIGFAKIEKISISFAIF